MSPFSRREFLQRSAILAAASATPAWALAQPQDEKKGSANDKLRVAVVGFRGRGRDHIDGFAAKNNCEVTVVCDCDEDVYAKLMKDKLMLGDKEKKTKGVIERQGFAPKYEKDFRKLLDDKSIDIISIATPNHWHALMAVWAMRAGKDVYCEKPATHNVHEGRLMVKAAQKYSRMCQVGTQSRSQKGMRELMEFLHSGGIGKVELAYATCYKNRPSIGKVSGEQAPPKTMDYDLWTGPAAMVMPKRNGKFGPVHYDWHWLWNYGNGDLGNQGVHEMDKARWGLQAGMPTSVVCVGGRVGYDDDGETPNTQLALFEFPTAKLIFEVRGLGIDKNKDKYHDVGVGNIFFGDKGTIAVNSYTSGVVLDPDGKKIKEFKGSGDHFGNFVQAVRSRNVKDLHCPAEEGHQSAAICHLANISYRLGTEATLDKPVNAMTDCKPAIEALDRMKAHLVKNGVDPSKAVGRAGAKLTFDVMAEKFADNKGANDLLFREYRKGFDITEAV